jgi:hypothetical protein
MNHAARLLGLALSSALLMPIAQIPSVLKPLKAAQAFEANEIPGLVGAVSEALHPSTSAEPWEPYMTALILAQDSGRDHPPAQESSDRCILTADQVEQLANAPDHRIRATAATLWAYSFFAKGKSLY